MTSAKRLRRPTVLVIAALGLALGMLIPATPSGAAPIDSPQAVTVESDCEGVGTVLVLHPGIGKPLWDVSSADVTGGPDYMIKSLNEDVFVNGVFIGTFVFSFGNRVGQGEPITCTFFETVLDGAGNLIEVHGSSELTVK